MDVTAIVTDHPQMEGRAVENEFVELATRMRPSLDAVALRIVGNRHDAADVVQESYLRAWRALPSFRGESRLSTWLHTIVVNRALSTRDRTRRRREEPWATDGSHEVVEHHTPDDPARRAEGDVLRQKLLEALRELPPGLRYVVVLRDVNGLSHDAIANQLDISVGASKIRLHRARRRLQETLAASPLRATA